MPRLLVLANLELSFDCPDGILDPDAFARLQERRLLKALETLAKRDARCEGNVERLEFESFTYGSSLQGEPQGYYYNKHESEGATGAP